MNNLDEKNFRTLACKNATSFDEVRNMVVDTANRKPLSKRKEQIRDRKSYLQRPIRESPCNSITVGNYSLVDRVIARAQNSKSNSIATSLNTR